ncbi:MAG: PAS domain S-box protein [Pseudomonadota bacterium]
MLDFLGKRLLLPVPENDRDAALVIRVFNSVCVSITVSLMAAAIGAGFIFVRKTSSLIIVFGLILLLFAALWIARRGRIRQAAMLQVCGLWGVFTVIIWLSGTVNTVFIGMYIAIIAMAGVLPGPRFAVGVAVMSIASCFGLTVLQSLGFTWTGYHPMPPWSAWFVFLFTIALIVPTMNGVLRAFGETAKHADHEIETRRKTEEILRESEAKYRSLFEQSGNAVAVYRPVNDGEDFVFVDLNKAGEQMERISRETVIGQSVVKMFPGIRELGLFEVFQRVWRTGEPEHHEAGHYKDERIQGWRDNHVYRLPSGEIVAVYSDETNRKQAEEALLQSEEKYRVMIENMHDVIYQTDMKGRINYVSPSTERLLGYTPEEVVGKKIYDFYAFPEETTRILKLLVENGSVTDLEVALLRKDGSHVWVSTNAGLLKDREGNPIGVEGVTRDITASKQAKQALQERERAWATLINNLPGFVYRCANDRDWTMEYVSDGCREVTGYEPDDFIGNKTISYNDIVGLDYQEPLRAKWQDLLSRKEPFEDEYPITARGGETRWVWERGQGVFSRDGRLLFLEGFITDITGRKESEKQGRMNEARLQSLHDIGQYGAACTQDLLDFALHEAVKLTGSKVGYIYHYDEEKRLFELNTWSKEVMKQCEVAEPKTLYELDKTGIWGEAVRQRKPVIVNDFQAPNPLKKGYPEGHVELHNFMTIPIFSGEKIVAVVGAANKDSDYEAGDVRQLSLLMASVWSINQAKRVEAVQRRLMTAVEQAVEGIIITDVQGHIEYVNPAYEKITGYSRDEIIGQKPTLFRIWEKDEPTRRAIIETLSRGERWGGHLVKERKDGGVYEEDVTVTPVLDTQGVVVNFVIVKRDVTREAGLQRQLLQAQKMEAIGTLAGGIAHDFNNLLHIISGHAELLEVELAERQLKFAELEAIRRAARRGADLVKQILTFSRRIDAKSESIDLNEEVRSTERLLYRTIPRMIEIDLRLEEGLERVRADSAQIEHMLINLALNAKDAMPEGGKLTIETRNVNLDEQYCKSHAGIVPGRYVFLRLSDTGHGMEEDVRQHIFEPFFTTKGLADGTGLGLATVFGIVTMHGGHITCESEAGRGTTFSIYFPAVKAAKPEVVGEREVTIVLPFRRKVVLA